MKTKLIILLLVLSGCGTLAGAGKDLKDGAKWLPEPYGAIAETVGTVLIMFAGHETVHHIRKRRAEKKAA